MRTVWRVIASFFGLGYFPVAPGTVASAAILVLYKLWVYRFGLIPVAAIALFLFVLGIPASASCSSDLRKTDPRSVVIDEAAGQLLVFVSVPPDWTALAVGFALFRFFDIFKPFPIRKAEELPGGWGIMADDAAAGVAAKALLHLFIYLR
jgi:phosphatidylglycerophosphatase A